MTIAAYQLFNGTLSSIITADKEKMLVRKSDNVRFYGPIALGDVYYLGGVKLDSPHFEVPDDYEEEDMTEEEKAVLNQLNL